MQELYKNIYTFGIPLRNNPLKELNCFVVKGEDQSMVVDTGFNTEENEKIMFESLEELGVDPAKTILVLTHLHADHTGLAAKFCEKGIPVYIGRRDGEIMQNYGPYWDRVVETSFTQGLAEDKLNLKDHPGNKFQAERKVEYKYLEEGDVIKVGEYTFEVVSISGHTPGIIGLYEKEHKLFFCGDHILGKITPNITYWGEHLEDSLGKYLENLDKVYDMEIDHLFSSHRFLVEDHRARIDELKVHHDKRLEEARQALRKYGPSTVRTVTKNLHWDIRSKSWDDFPASQKWFAAGEAQAHLERLRALGEVDYEVRDGVWYYYLLEK